MKAFGYEKEKKKLLKLSEVTLECDLEEIDKIIEFLITVKESHDAVKEKTDMCHSHFRDWDKKWNENQSDIIIVTKF